MTKKHAYGAKESFRGSLLNMIFIGMCKDGVVPIVDQSVFTKDEELAVEITNGKAVDMLHQMVTLLFE